MSKQRILIVGLGHLGSQVLDLLMRIPGQHALFVGGRNIEYLQQRTNLSLFSAMQMGYSPEVECIHLDLWNREQTAEVLYRVRPDLIFCAATLQHTEAIHHLPPSIAEQLALAQLGPRLPLHLVLIYRLMQSVKLTGRTIKVINALYPDVVGPVLNKVGLAPTTGIGDLANNVPALRQSIALNLTKPVQSVHVHQIMARYVSYWMSRICIKDTPFHFTALFDGEDVSDLLDLDTIFGMLPTTLKRLGGNTGLLMTAASAAVVIEGIVNNTGVITHAPGPNGLPGGYPVQVSAQGVKITLPDDLTLETAIEINEAGLLLDGIERIESDGTVWFTEKHMSILNKILGYECRRMPLSEVEQQARELLARYEVFASRYS
jgi:hypothetical protein